MFSLTLGGRQHKTAPEVRRFNSTVNPLYMKVNRTRTEFTPPHTPSASWLQGYGKQYFFVLPRPLRDTLTSMASSRGLKNEASVNGVSTPSQPDPPINNGLS